MSPTYFHDQHHHHAKTSNNNLLCPPALKINKDSHVISKASSKSPPSSSSTSSLGVAGPAKPPQRHPVIIYTHSPKIIHTHPRDFMALVQKLTGLSQSDDNDDHNLREKHKKGNRVAEDEIKNLKMVGNGNDDNESSSVITDENCGSTGEGQVNSCFMPPIFEPNNPNFITNIPVFTPNSAHFLCTNQPFYNYTNSLFFPPPPLPLPLPNLRTSVSSSSSMKGMNEFRDY